MPSLSRRQAQVLAAIQQLQENNEMPITREKLSRMINTTKGNIARIIYSIRQRYSNPEYMIKTTHLHGKYGYELNTVNMVTTRTAARVFCELKKAVIAAGVIDQQDFEEQILSDPSFMQLGKKLSKRRELLHIMIQWGQQVGYVDVWERNFIRTGTRLNEEYDFLEKVGFRKSLTPISKSKSLNKVSGSRNPK